MNYASIKQYDIANGIGVRISLFVSGCTHHCKGCFNREAWDFKYGKSFTKDIENEIIKYLEPNYIKGLSLLGGEPFEENNVKVLLPFIKRIKDIYPNKDIWAYSGYLFEELLEKKISKELLKYVDVLVDGKFVVKLKDPSLPFRGSSNQRIIDVKNSFKKGSVIFHPKMRKA